MDIYRTEIPRVNRTETPNIVFEMMEEGLISYCDFVLYSFYRRIAGQEGACWVGTIELEKKLGISDKTIKNSKKTLSSSFECLNGKSLIEITPCDRKKGIGDNVTIIDIWPENFEFFKRSIEKSINQ